MNTTTLNLPQARSVEYYRNFYAEKCAPVKRMAINIAIDRLDHWQKEPETPLKRRCVHNLENILIALGVVEA